MDKILKEENESFSERFGPIDLANASPSISIASKYGSMPDFISIKGGNAEKVDFANDSFESSQRRGEDDSYCSYEKDLVTSENSARFPPGKNFPCPYKNCRKVYTSSYGLKYHMDHGHTAEKSNEKRPYVCNINNCGKTYKNNNGLKYHIHHAHKGHSYVESDYS